MTVVGQFLRPLLWTLVLTMTYAGVGLGIAAFSGHGNSLKAATGEAIVSDKVSGVAIFGVDPVAYFTDGAMVEGKPDVETTVAGVIWRFVNQGNLQAFSANPDVYAPRFGGYDPVAVSEGHPTAGTPVLWAIHEQRLYLFFSEANLNRFKAAPERYLTAAEQGWPSVTQKLVK